MRMKKNLGIWMDHANAHLMEFITDSIEIETIPSAFTHRQKEDSMRKSESLMHQKEQHQHLTYYGKLGQVIKHYNDVLLFGPTDAKAELLNMLRTDHAFDKINLITKPADKMTKNQRNAFVKEYFHDLAM